jgi:ATP sulfurylase
VTKGAKLPVELKLLGIALSVALVWFGVDYLRYRQILRQKCKICEQFKVALVQGLASNQRCSSIDIHRIDVLTTAYASGIIVKIGSDCNSEEMDTVVETVKILDATRFNVPISVRFVEHKIDKPLGYSQGITINGKPLPSF